MSGREVEQRWVQRRRRWCVGGLIGSAVALMLGAGGGASAQAAGGELGVTTDSALYPSFNPDVRTYVTHCSDDPLRVRVRVPNGTSVRIDRDPARGRSFSKRVSLEPGAAFSVRSRERRREGGRTTYRIRCLPENFPEWDFERRARPDSRWLLTAFEKFTMIFDRRGTPVWWFEEPQLPIDANVLTGGRLVWGVRNGEPTPSYEIRNLEGELERRLRTVGTKTDLHDLQEFANGNYLLMSYKPRDGVDLTAYGGTADETVKDAELQEVTPDGKVVWSWNSKDHIALAETGRWWEMGIGPPGRPGWDIVHINSAEIYDDSMLISMRHTDAIYSIDRATGEVEWKLGGTETPESLTVLGDSHGDYPFGGQHDGRLHGKDDSVLTAFDNAHELDRDPRGARYRIDEDADTARLIDSLGDPTVSDSRCCGSHRRTNDGGAVVTWGWTAQATGFKPDGSVRYRLEMLNASPPPLYRVVPVPDGELEPRGLRRGMNAMQPHDDRVAARVKKLRISRRKEAVSIRVRGRESLSAKARGSIRIAGKRYPLSPAEAEIEGGKARRLRLRPETAADAGAIERRLDAGKRGTARVKVSLRDRSFNRRVEQLRARVRG